MINRIAFSKNPGQRERFTYSYDSGGNIASVQSSHQNGVNLSYGYDELNRLISVVDHNLSAPQNTTTFGYDAVSGLVTVSYPNGLAQTRQLDVIDHVLAITNSSASQVPGVSYQRNPFGDIVSSTETTGRSVMYSYDGLHRVTSETVSGDLGSINGNTTFAYDAVDNFLASTSTLAQFLNKNQSYDSLNRLIGYTYDRNGNVLQSPGHTYTYDFRDRVVAVDGTVTFKYDGDNGRFSKTAGGLETQYLIDDLSPTGFPQVVEEIQGGQVQTVYAYGPIRLSISRLVSGNWAPAFYGYDGQANVRFLSDASGLITDTYKYEAFGAQISHTGTSPNQFLFRGERYDPETGLYYLRARYYDPQTRRFVTEDTYRLQDRPKSICIHVK